MASRPDRPGRNLAILALTACVSNGVAYAAQEAWTRKNYDLGGTSSYQAASAPNSGRLALAWQSGGSGYPAVLTVDLDGDGVLDILGSDGATLTSYDGWGRVLWSAPAAGRLSYVGDVDADGLPEICVARRTSSTLYVDVYDESGTFQKSITRSGGSDGHPPWVLTHAGDSLVVTYWSGYSLQPRGVGILSYSSGGEVAYYCLGGGGVGPMGIGDPDADGRLEIAVGGTTTHNGFACNGATDGDLYGVLLELDLENGVIAPEFTRYLGTWNPSTNPNGELTSAMPDLDGDGVPEILFLEAHQTYYPGTDHVYRVDATGDLLDSWQGGYSNALFLLGSTIGDVNGDGVRELVFSPSGSDETITTVDGATMTSLATLADAGQVLGSVDFDGDGWDEIVAYEATSGEVRVFDGATLVQESHLFVGGLTVQDWYIVNRFCISDVTGDGIVELILGGEFGVTVLRPDEPGTRYCLGDGSGSACPCSNVGGAGGGCANSTGTGASLGSSGSASVSADDLVLTAWRTPSNRAGLLYMGGSAGSEAAFGDGQRCVAAGAAGLFRFLPVSNSGSEGLFRLGPGIAARSQGFAANGRIQPGQTWYFQAWFRDPMGPCASGYNLSNGTSVSFVP